MSRNRQTRPTRRDQASKPVLHLIEEQGPQTRPVRRSNQPLQPQTAAQARYIEAIGSNTITFGLGPAGVGKTWLASALAAAAYEGGETKRILVTRPAVEAGESLGFLPGELEEKYEPWLRPVKEVLVERLGSGPVEYMIKVKDLEAMPLAYMRGNTFKDAWVILDEAQNVTPAQMYLFLTRIGNAAKIIINGDLLQKDIPGRSGLEDATRRLQGLEDVSVVKFTADDIVRSGIVKEIVRRYSETSAESSERYIDEHEDDVAGLNRVLRVA